MNIHLIDSPVYVVDFQEFIPVEKKKNLNLNQKIQAAAEASFHYSKIFFMSLNEAAYKTVSNMGVSFKYIVLGYYGSLRNFKPPSDVYLAVFKVAFWVLSLGWSLTVTTGRLFAQKAFHPNNIAYLQNFAEEGMNLNHIQTKEISLDVSNVPADVKVDDLVEMFNKIEFHNSDALGYVSPNTLREGTTRYSASDLKESLQTFIKRVKTREAFLGTPPAYDVLKLMEFYQQIEDAVRLSIHKVNQDLADFLNKNPDIASIEDKIKQAEQALIEFQKKNGTNDSQYDENQQLDYKRLVQDKTSFANQKNEYIDLLHARARLVIDLAIAGKHCGARYMGEAMGAYYYYFGEATLGDKDLKDSLSEILAHKRREIAMKHIQMHLGTDTHSFNKYMANLGEILGIPGTKNIIEHLDQSFDRNHYLTLFFEEYTVDLVIDTIQEKFQKSHHLRSKSTDWIKDQVKDWKKSDYQNKVSTAIQEMTEILRKEVAHSEGIQHIQNFQTLINACKAQQIDLPSVDKWDEFLDELLALNSVKNWFKAEFPALNPIQLGKKKQEFKSTLDANTIGLELVKDLQGFVLETKEIRIDAFSLKFNELEKVKKLRQCLQGCPTETLLRIIAGGAKLEDVVTDYFEHERSVEFLNKLKLDNLGEQEGFSKEILEWLMVSQEILLPQMIRSAGSNIQNGAVGSEQNYENYFSTVIQAYEEGANLEEGANHHISQWIQNGLKSQNIKEIEDVATQILQDFPHLNPANQKRYTFKSLSHTDVLLKAVFDQAFKHAPDAVTKAAESIASQKIASYPLWKKTCLIKIPKTIAYVCQTKLFKIAAAISMLAVSVMVGYQAYEAVTAMSLRVIPTLINYTPIKVIKMSNLIFDIKDWVFDHSLEILLCTWLARRIISQAPRIPYITATVESINLWNIYHFLFMTPQTIAGFLLNTGLNTAKFAWDGCNHIGQYLQYSAQKREKEITNLLKTNAHHVWEQAVQKAFPVSLEAEAQIA